MHQSQTIFVFRINAVLFPTSKVDVSSLRRIVGKVNGENVVLDDAIYQKSGHEIYSIFRAILGTWGKP